MSADYYEDVWTAEGERVRIYPDDDAADAWDYEHLGVIASLDDRWTGGSEDAAVRAYFDDDDDAPVIVDDLRHRLARDYGAAAVLLLRRLHEGGYIVLDATQGDLDGIRWDAVAFDTAKGRESWGAPLDKAEECLRAEVEEYTAWARGDVWVAVKERRITWQRSDSPDDIMHTWEVEDSVGCIIGNGYAHETALEYFPQPVD